LTLTADALDTKGAIEAVWTGTHGPLRKAAETGMVIATGRADTVAAVAAVIIAVVLAIPVFRGCLWFYRAFTRRAEAALALALADLNIREQPEPGDVLVVFHTYHGLIG